jgi:ribA/ribD-fused uncharacterized protein
MTIEYNMKTWRLGECNWFWKTGERNGFLSNMCAGYPLTFALANGGGKVTFATSEALYQAARFPERPFVQEQIAQEKNPMKGKMIARQYDSLTRPDWFDVRVRVMKWVVYQKWFQHQSFRDQLAALDGRPIVEYSTKDDFWGAKPTAGTNETAQGSNVLGQILQFRKDFVFGNRDPLFSPMQIPDPVYFKTTLIEYSEPST